MSQKISAALFDNNIPDFSFNSGHRREGPGEGGPCTATPHVSDRNTAPDLLFDTCGTRNFLFVIGYGGWGWGGPFQVQPWRDTGCHTAQELLEDPPAPLAPPFFHVPVDLWHGTCGAGLQL